MIRLQRYIRLVDLMVADTLRDLLEDRLQQLSRFISLYEDMAQTGVEELLAGRLPAPTAPSTRLSAGGGVRFAAVGVTATVVCRPRGAVANPAVP